MKPKTFTIYHNGKKKEITIAGARLRLIDCVSVDAEFEGITATDTLLTYFSDRAGAFIRFRYEKDDSYDYIKLTQPMIEWIWEQVGKPHRGLFYQLTENYKANWED